MQLMKPSFKILSIMGMYGGASEAQPLKLIELAGRTCYKSGEAITSESAKEFSRLRIKQKHESVIEHSAMTVQFIVDRGVTHEKVRHRLCAFSQESTRFVNYAKSDEIAVIIPFFFDPLEILKSIKVPNGYFYSVNNKGTWEFSSYEEIMMNSFDVWFLTCLWSQWGYMTLVNEFNRKPEQARTVLPNSTKTEIVVTANFREWKHIFNLRCSKAAHPQMREIMIPLLKECQKQIPVIFDNITYDENFYHEHDNRTV
jgi:thymidylate synthase (FAD)